MKIEAFETKFSVEDVVWFMYDNKPTRGIVCQPPTNEFAGLS